MFTEIDNSLVINNDTPQCPLSCKFSATCNNPNAILEAYDKICDEVSEKLQEMNH